MLACNDRGPNVVTLTRHAIAEEKQNWRIGEIAVRQDSPGFVMAEAAVWR